MNDEFAHEFYSNRYDPVLARQYLNAVDSFHKTALFYCIEYSLVEEAKVLLTTKLINTNIPDAVMRTPLHMATEEADRDTMELLLNYGADANAKNEGWSKYLICT